jgi:ribonuclease P protein component
MSCKFPKAERLNSKADIDLLFEKGRSLRHDALSLRWMLRERQEAEPSIRVLMAVPKRNMKLAVHRNRTKRQLRELYRLNKNLWPAVPSNKTLVVGVIYLGRTQMDYPSLENAFIGLMEKFGRAFKRDD